jgi:hypothetical protein
MEPAGSNRPNGTPQTLPLGAHVRLRRRQATGVVVGYSPDFDRVQVQWDDTRAVTHILIPNLERVPAASE